MNIQGYQKLTLLDFPGKTAATVFCGGCNLRCPFCHNASLVLTPREGENKEEEVLSYLEKRKGILDGICITGGEPLLQPDLTEFMEKVKKMGFSVKLDTNGGDPERLKRVLETGLVDMVAMDVKSAPESYSAACGKEVDVSRFLESIRILQKGSVPYEFRTTAVKGIHSEADFHSIATLLEGEEKYFLQSFVDSGNVLKGGCSAFSPEEMKKILQIVRTKIPCAALRGVEE